MFTHIFLKIYKITCKIPLQTGKFIAGPTVVATQQDAVQQESGQNYQQLLQQREEENRQEVERLTAEIRALKLQLLQLTSE